MLKCKVTKKEILENYKNVIKVGYCELQHLLNYKCPRFFTAGAYGWNTNIYEISYSTVIVTGYAPFGNISNYELTKKYEEKAEKIVYDNKLDFNKKSKKLDKLIGAYIKAILQSEEE